MIIRSKKRKPGSGCYRTRLAAAGTCPKCGRRLVHRPIQNMWVCPQRTKDPLWKARFNAAKLRFEDDALAWLGDKLSVNPQDPRLRDVAIELARKGHLVVLLSKNGSIIAIGKTKT